MVIRVFSLGMNIVGNMSDKTKFITEVLFFTDFKHKCYIFKMLYSWNKNLSLPCLTFIYCVSSYLLMEL